MSFENITPRERTEATVSEPLPLLQALFDNALDAILVADDHGRYVEANPAACTLTGYNREELLARSVWDLTPSSNEELGSRLWQAFIAAGRQMGEYALVCKDGTTITTEYRAVANIVPGLHVSIMRDITGRKQAEEALRRSEAHFRTIFERAGIGIGLTDMEARIVSANPVFCHMLGYAESELVGKHVADITYLDDFEAEKKHLQPLLAGSDGIYQMEKRYLHKDGHLVWGRLTATVVRDDGDLPLCAIGMVEDITERKQAEKQLQTSEQKYRTLFEMAADALVLVHAWGPDAQIVEANQSTLDLLGYTLEELRQRTGREIMAPEVQEETYAERRRQLAEKNHFLTETVLVRKDGRRVPVSVSGRAVDLEGEQIFQFIVRDTSEQVRGQQEQEDLSRIYHTLSHRQPGEALEQTLAVLGEILPISGAGLITWEAGETHYQYSKQWIQPEFKAEAKAILQVLAGAIGERLPMRTAGALDRVIEPAAAWYVPDIRDSYFWGSDILARFGVRSTYTVPVVLQERFTAVLMVVSTQVDGISSHQREFVQKLLPTFAAAVEAWHYEQQLQALNRTLESLVNHLPDGVLLLDGEQRIVLANPTAQQYLVALGQRGRGHVLISLGNHPLERLLEAPVGERPWQEIRSEAGRIFEVTAQPLGSDSQIDGWVLVLRDVTKQREHQQYLQRQDQLAAIGQLAAGIAHDFNNILAVITLYSQMLRRNPHLIYRERYLETIYQQCQHAANLINQILDFSRQSIMHRGTLHIVPFLKATVKLLMRTLPATINMELTYTSDDLTVESDPTRLQQMIMNLAINARDAMPGGGQLHLALSALALKPGQKPPFPEMEPRLWACLAISDTGHGILPEVLPQIFEPFFTTKLPGEGTGLGLAQVYGIVKQHGGEIVVQSQPGTGTTFTIYLPAHQITGVDAAEPNATMPMGGKQETILVVEDNAATREALAEMLVMLGYRSITAGSGQEALDLFSRAPEAIDLVLTDIVMPRMGGIELYHILKQVRPEVKVILMSGYPLGDQGRSLLEQGIVSWLQKPFSLEEIGAQLHQALT